MTCFESVFLIVFAMYCALIVAGHLPKIVKLMRAMKSHTPLAATSKSVDSNQ